MNWKWKRHEQMCLQQILKSCLCSGRTNTALVCWAAASWSVAGLNQQRICTGTMMRYGHAPSLRPPLNLTFTPLFIHKTFWQVCLKLLLIALLIKQIHQPLIQILLKDTIKKSFKKLKRQLTENCQTFKHSQITIRIAAQGDSFKQQKTWLHFSFLINSKTKITTRRHRGAKDLEKYESVCNVIIPLKYSAKMILWLFCKINDVARNKLLNYKALEVSTKAYWTPSSLIVQTWLGDCGSSGRSTTRPPVGRTGAQDNSFVFPNKVTWRRIKFHEVVTFI